MGRDDGRLAMGSSCWTTAGGFGKPASPLDCVSSKSCSSFSQVLKSFWIAPTIRLILQKIWKPWFQQPSPTRAVMWRPTDEEMLRILSDADIYYRSVKIYKYGVTRSLRSHPCTNSYQQPHLWTYVILAIFRYVANGRQGSRGTPGLVEMS